MVTLLRQGYQTVDNPSLGWQPYPVMKPLWDVHEITTKPVTPARSDHGTKAFFPKASGTVSETSGLRLLEDPLGDREAYPFSRRKVCGNPLQAL
jgi:hypothetical protein